MTDILLVEQVAPDTPSANQALLYVKSDGRFYTKDDAGTEYLVSHDDPLLVGDGGTGVVTLADAGVLIGNGTGAVQVTGAGTSGQVLTSNGAGVDPTFQAANTLGTEQATTSGTSTDFTIPAGVRAIQVMPVGVSTNGTSDFLIQLGDAGGIETTGYRSSVLNAAAGTASTAGFIVIDPFAAASLQDGLVLLRLEDSSDFTWVECGVVSDDSNRTNSSAGSKSLSAALTTVRITTVNGTDTFDAGVINVSYQS